jgi:hypothetical protein
MYAGRVNRLFMTGLVLDLQCSCYCKSIGEQPSRFEVAVRLVWRTGNGKLVLPKSIEVKNATLGANMGRPSM